MTGNGASVQSQAQRVRISGQALLGTTASSGKRYWLR